MKVFKDSAINSAKELVKGPKHAKGVTKHIGKALLIASALSSVIGVANAVSIKKQSSSTNYVDKDRKYVVS